MEQEKILIGRFYQEFWVFFGLLIACVIGIVFFLVFYITKLKKFDYRIKIVYPILLGVIIAITVVVGITFSNYYKDHIYLKHNNPIKIKGEVIGFSQTTNNDFIDHNSWPIILINGTSDKISLGVYKSNERVVIGQEYTFIYLPNTKNAELLI